METSEYIAALIGPVLIATSLSMLINREHFDKLIGEIATSPALIFSAGIAALVIGLAIVRTHNIWVWDWPVLVTLFGWLAIIGGLMRILMPKLIIKIAKDMTASKPPITIAAVVIIPLGILLTAYGFRLIT